MAQVSVVVDDGSADEALEAGARVGLVGLSAIVRLRGALVRRGLLAVLGVLEVAHADVDGRARGEVGVLLVHEQAEVEVVGVLGVRVRDDGFAAVA